MSLNKIKKLMEDINVKGTPTRDALDKASVGLYRKAFYDYRDKTSERNKYYLRGVQDALILALGRNNYEKMKRRIKSEYSGDKI